MNTWPFNQRVFISIEVSANFSVITLSWLKMRVSRSDSSSTMSSTSSPRVTSVASKVLDARRTSSTDQEMVAGSSISKDFCWPRSVYLVTEVASSTKLFLPSFQLWLMYVSSTFVETSGLIGSWRSSMSISEPEQEVRTLKATQRTIMMAAAAKFFKFFILGYFFLFFLLC